MKKDKNGAQAPAAASQTLKAIIAPQMTATKALTPKAPPKAVTGKTVFPAKTRGDAPPSKNIIAALDIGTSKVCCFIAEVKAHGTLDVVGIGHQASKGVKAGAIIDLKAAEAAVAHAVEAAEHMARDHLLGQPIRAVYVNVPGTHTLSHQLKANVRIHGPEVTERDVRQALALSGSVEAPGKDELIHIISTSYSLDGQRGIQEPRGMAAQTMEARLAPVTALSAATRNIAAVLHQNSLEPAAYCATPYAAGLACLVEDEMELGCTVIDMGGGTTSIGVFFEGRLVYTSAIPVGGHHVTNDIARGLITSLTDAERIKTLYGTAQSAATDDSAMIDVPPMGEEEHAQPNYVPRSLLGNIIQPRIEETFELVRARLVDSGVNQAAGRRVVLTGGASQLPGLCDIGRLILDKQIRLGRPQKIKGLAESTGGPAFSACAGLLHYAAERAEEIPTSPEGYGFALGLPFCGDLLHKVTLWLKENW
jgi:cell division protein FtsA